MRREAWIRRQRVIKDTHAGVAVAIARIAAGNEGAAATVIAQRSSIIADSVVELLERHYSIRPRNRTLRSKKRGGK